MVLAAKIRGCGHDILDKGWGMEAIRPDAQNVKAADAAQDQ